MNYAQAYELGKEKLAEAGIEEAALDARLLLEYVCGTNCNTLLVHGDREVASEEAEQYEGLIHRRAERIPLQHLTGQQDFMGLTFLVNEKVLIPRQDTEILVEEMLKELHDGMHILDMCTGSGCILISLLHYSNDCSGVGADLSPDALSIAKENAGQLLCGAWSDKIDFVQTDLFENIAGKFDRIVSNPPYIRTEVLDELMPEVRDHEPRMALDGSLDGLYFYRKIVEQAGEHLKRGGMLYFEIGYDQGDAVSELMRAAGYLEVEVVKDYSGLDRVVYGTYLG